MLNVLTLCYYGESPRAIAFHLFRPTSRGRLLDALHFAMITHAVYHYAISNYMNPSALETQILYDAH